MIRRGKRFGQILGQGKSVGKGSFFSPERVSSGPTLSVTSNLVLWLKADSGTFSDAARTTPVSTNGSEVKGWADQSGANNHASIGTANGPTILTGQANGQAALNFNNYYFNLANTNDLAAGDLFVVAEDSTGGHVLSGGASSSAYFYLGSNFARMNVTGHGGGDLNGYVDTNISASAPFAAHFSFTSTENKAYTNNVHTTPASNTGEVGIRALTGTPRFNLKRVGEPSIAAGQSVVAKVYEILVYSARLSDADRGSVYTYLSSRYAIS